MPVKSTSFEVAKSSYLGGSRWMGYSVLRSSWPMPSMASPVTLSSRPLIWLPMGMEMGLPDRVTSMPRMRPSVESIAMVRTESSPMCC